MSDKLEANDLVCTIGPVPEELQVLLDKGESVMAVFPENNPGQKYWLAAMSDGRVAVLTMNDKEKK
jgi:hypothetical protein